MTKEQIFREKTSGNIKNIHVSAVLLTKPLVLICRFLFVNRLFTSPSGLIFPINKFFSDEKAKVMLL